MGQSQSGEHSSPPASTEQLSHDLALRFATKCFTPLELSHFKDNFRTLADTSSGVRYWKEDTLCRFLRLPDSLAVGPVIYQLCTYLGAFPFPSLSPSILTLEAMVKVIVIMTERYKKVLKKGGSDRGKLLFRGLAVFDRRMTEPSAEERPKVEMEMEREVEKWENAVAVEDPTSRSHIDGFVVDRAVDDDGPEEDDDELALAALESLDAIEVFKVDQKADFKIQHALIPVENLKRLVMFLLVIAPLEPLEDLARYTEGLDEDRLKGLEKETDCILASFNPDPKTGGISYSSFICAVSASLPRLFEPLNALFEHFLFSKNMDLSRKRGSASSMPPPSPESQPPKLPYLPDDIPESLILNESLVSHLSFCLPTVSGTSLLHEHVRFHPIYSTATHGTSLTSISSQVLSWESPTLLLVTGTPATSGPTTSSSSSPPLLTIGASIPNPWKSSSSSSPPNPVSLSSLFLLSPVHARFLSTPRPSNPLLHFDLKSGISFGCTIPPSSRTNQHPHPISGPVSLYIDPGLEKVRFKHTVEPGSSYAACEFLKLPPGFSHLSQSSSKSTSPASITLNLDLEALEIWGLTSPDSGDEVAAQRERLKWEEREAERRARVNFGSDREGAKALLELAGIVGERSGGVGGRSGGSV